MHSKTTWTRREVLALALPLALPWASALAAGPAAVAESLGRPAIATRRGGQGFLLGAARAGKRIVAVGERGLVVVSDGGGKSWHQVLAPVSVTLTGVRFADAQHGVAVGHGGVVLLSSDGGDHWTLALDGRRAAAIVLDAARAGQDEVALADAERLVADGPDKPFLDVLMSSPRDIVVVGAYGLALASSDGGRTWASLVHRLENPRGLHFYSIRRHGSVIVLAGEQGLALRSVDGGHVFQRLETPYKGSFFTVELPGDDDILLAGLRGNAWRSHDAGTTWVQIPSPMNASFTTSIATAEGGVLLGNQAGFVYRVAGESLEPLNASALPPINGLVFGGRDQLLALTPAGALPVQASAT